MSRHLRQPDRVAPVSEEVSPAAVEVRGLAKSYGRVRVLSDLDLSVLPGELVGLEGENGAGKSTLLRCLVGMLAADGGEVRIQGVLGYCPQEPTLVGVLTAAEHFRMFGAGYGLDAGTVARRSAELMERYSCSRYADVRVDQMSGGTRQKVNLILALLPRPDVLVLDEPYQGFDHETYLIFWDHVEELRRDGGAVIVVSHMHTEKGRFDRLLRLRDGRLEPAAARPGMHAVDGRRS